MKTALAFNEPEKEEHHIVFGTVGWTESWSPELIRQMLNVGVIRKIKSTGGTGWITHVYCSTNGVLPDEYKP